MTEPVHDRAGGGFARALGRGVARVVQLVLTIVFLLAHILSVVAFRLALFVLTLYFLIYFFLNSGFARVLIEQVTDRFLPGRIEFGAIEWGPAPWRARVVDAHFITERGESVIRAGEVTAEVDFAVLFDYIVHGLIRKEKSVTLRIAEAFVRNYEVNLDFRLGGRPTIADVFRPRHPPPGPPKPPRTKPLFIEVDHILTRDGVVNFHFRDGNAQLRGVSASAGRVRVAGTTPLQTTVEVAHVAMPRGFVVLRPGLLNAAYALPVDVAAADLQASGFAYRGRNVFVERLRGLFSGLHLDGGVAVLLEGEHRLIAHAALTGSAADRLIAGLVPAPLSGAFRLRALAGGPLASPTIAIDLTAPTLRLAAADLNSVRLAGELRPRPGDGRTFDVRVSQFVADACGGHLDLSEARYAPRDNRFVCPFCDANGGEPAGANHVFSGKLALQNLDLQRVAAELGTLFELPVPAEVARTVSGRLDVQGALFGEAPALPTLRAQVQADLQATRDTAGHPALAGAYDLAGTLDVTAPQARAPTLRLTGVEARAGRDTLAVEGSVDLAERTLDVQLDAAVPDVAPLAAALGAPGIGGGLEVRDTLLSGSLANPEAQGRLVATGPRVAGLRADDARLRFRLSDGRLSVQGLRLRAPWAQASLDGQLRLWQGSLLVRPKSYPFRLDNVRVDDLKVEHLFPQAAIVGRAAIHDCAVRGDLADLRRSFVGAGALRLWGLRLGGEVLDRVVTRVEANARQLRLAELRITGPSGLDMSGEGTLDRKTGALAGSLRLVPLSLTSLWRMIGKPLPVTGSLGLEVKLGGTLAEPELDARIPIQKLWVRLSAEGVRPSRNLKLGDAVLRLTRAAAGPLKIGAEPFFKGLAIGPSSALQLRGLAPERLDLFVDIPDLDLRTPIAAVRDLLSEVVLNGRLVVAYDFRPSDAVPWDVALHLPRAGLRLATSDSNLRYTSPDPAILRWTPEGLAVQGLRLRGGMGDDLAVCGLVSPAGAADLFVAGSLGADLLRAYKRSFAVLEGRVTVAESPELLTPAAAACLGKALDNGRGALHVAGPLARPLVRGRLVFDGVQVLPRGLGQEFRLASGSEIRLTGEPGPNPVQRVVIPQESGIRGELEEGVFSLWGTIDLQNWLPTKGTLHLAGTDLSYAASQQYSVTCAPNLRYEFDRLADPDNRWHRLSGEVTVQEGAYYRSFDTLTRALGGVLGREQAAPTLSLTEAVPALANLEFGVSIVGRNFEVRSKFPAGRADMELAFNLQLDGTLARPLLWDRVDILPGSVVTYNVFKRDFEVQGTVDFRGDPSQPHLSVQARTDISYFEAESPGRVAESGSEALPEQLERNATITLFIEGVYPNLDIKPTSDDSRFSEADLWSLIVTGQPSDPSRRLTNQSSFSLLTDDLADIVRKTMLSAFVDTVSIGFTQAGGIDTAVMKRLGRLAVLRARVVQQGGTTTAYQTGFEFKLSDRLSLEGNLRVYEDPGTTAPTRRYETKLRYRIPVE